MFALLFLFAFQKDESFTHLSCLPFTLASLAKHSSFYPFFCSLTTSPCKKMTCTPGSGSVFCKEKAARRANAAHSPVLLLFLYILSMMRRMTRRATAIATISATQRVKRDFGPLDFFALDIAKSPCLLLCQAQVRTNDCYM